MRPVDYRLWSIDISTGRRRLVGFGTRGETLLLKDPAGVPKKVPEAGSFQFIDPEFAGNTRTDMVEAGETLHALLVASTNQFRDGGSSDRFRLHADRPVRKPA